MALVKKKYKNQIFKRNKFLRIPKVVKKRVGGGTLIQSPAVFSSDSEYVYVNSGWGVRVFNVNTGECVKVLETTNSGYGRVLSILIISDYPVVATIDILNQIYLLHWDPKRYVKRKTELKLPLKYESWIGVNAFLVPSLRDRSTQDLCLIVESQVGVFKVFFYNPITADHIQKHPLNGVSVGYRIARQMLAFGGPPEMRIMATIVDNLGLCFYSLDGSKKLLKWRTGSRDVVWVSVACHPTEPCVAVGDSLGRCVLFRNPLLNAKVKTIFHWHTLPCKVIAFSPAGSSMYTGGGEHVLVKWNIENPNVKHCLPRLSAPIVHITTSPDNSLLSVSTLDNGIILVDSSHKVKCVLQQLAWGVLSHPETVLFPSELNFHYASQSIVLNSRPGHLQFFSPETETLTSVDICQQNYLTQERSKVIVNTDITRVAITSNSTWMATIETRQELNVSLELRLKLWQYEVSNKRWNLNSVIEMPHSGPVGCLKFRLVSATQDSNPDYLLVTTGKDDKFRLWSPTPIDSIYKKGVIWRCEGAASYKDRTIGPACFSHDGSLLAVAFEHITTLWSMDGLKFKTSLSGSTLNIKQVEFGGESCSHLVVTANDNEVTVWNLLTLCIQWTAKVYPTFLISDPSTSFMALFSYNKNLYIFNPHCPDPVYTEKKLCNLNVDILGATFALREAIIPNSPIWLQKSVLYYIDSNQELHCFKSEEEIQSDYENLHLIEDEEKTTLFGTLEKVQSQSLVKKVNVSHPRMHQYGEIGASAISEFLKAPCHSMAPISTLCASLLSALALSKKSVSEKEGEEEMEVDDSEDDEGIGGDSDSDIEVPIKATIGKDLFEMPKASKLPLKILDCKPNADELFFIDVDDEVDKIING